MARDKQYMSVDHAPPHSYGDCHRACIATMLSLPIEDVPHFAFDGPDGKTFHRRVDDFLASRGLAVVSVPYDKSATLAQVLDCVAAQTPGLIFMVGGLSESGASHTCIYRGKHLWHDPRPNGEGIIGPCPSTDH